MFTLFNVFFLVKTQGFNLLDYTTKNLMAETPDCHTDFYTSLCIYGENFTFILKIVLMYFYFKTLFRIFVRRSNVTD